MKEWIKRQFCRVGLHRQGVWIQHDNIQSRSCHWCYLTEFRSLDDYSLTQILMEFAKRKDK